MKNRLKIQPLQMEYKPQRNQKMRLIEGLALLLHEETMIIGQLKEVTNEKSSDLCQSLLAEAERR